VGGGDGCGSSSEDYILDAAWKDGLLVGGIFTGAVLVCAAMVIVGLLFPSQVARLHGKEYMRIRSLRAAGSLGESAMGP